MQNPVSTYRFQFHKDFNFLDVENLLAYFRKLGIGSVYASPILESVPGSTHGYDGVNPDKIDPEIGTLDGLRRLARQLSESGIGWVQDIVPNHMAFHSGNGWLMDVLEKGEQSLYSRYFDIAWNNRMFKGRVMVPFLGKNLDEVITDNELSVRYDQGRLHFDYAGSLFPLSPRSYATILQIESLEKTEALAQLVSQLDDLHGVEDPRMFSTAWDEWITQFRSLYENGSTDGKLGAVLEEINGSALLLNRLADEQNYVLCLWQETEEQINFRRFFTVNGLICLNMQDEEVFDDYHRLIAELLKENVIQGLRIDHVDGLFDPSDYLEKLRRLTGEELYIVVEKILEKNESLPADWQIEGTTGYDYLATVNNLLTNAAAAKAFDDFYGEMTGNRDAVKDQLIAKKSEILYGHMGGELDNLTHLFVELELVGPETLERLGLEQIREVIAAFLIYFPVYRFYGNTMPLPDHEIKEIKKILIEITKQNLDLSPAVELLEQCFIHAPTLGDDDYNRRALEFYQRCMQFTGPLMAKGGEDTLMYTNNKFIGHNEVGDFPDRFGLSAADFHKSMQKRSKEWPLAMNATATHDTKRGEDVRARLNVLTDCAEEWFDKVREWRELRAKSESSGQSPDPNDEYLIYQTLMGAHPMPGQDIDDFPERVAEYLQKALREAKTKTSWSAPDEDYEKAAKDFAAELLRPGSAFMQSFTPFLEHIADFGIINSLTQLVLKFTCPGVPDVYQGCELWDFSLVDPDNRRKVDFGKRSEWLNGFEGYETDRLAEKLWEERRDGKIKLWLTQRLYQLRRQHPQLFTKGDYLPLKVRGVYKEYLLAFARRHKKDVYVTVVPLHPAILCKEQQRDFFGLDWKDTHVVLPDNMLPEWEDVFTSEQQHAEGKLVPGEFFQNMPFAILKGRKADSERDAGLLLHITSLPSPFGIGDIGPAAFEFADFLEKTNQRTWQILPLNPTEGSQANSPYSALSSMAGNPLLISPEVLADEGWLSEQEVADHLLPATSEVDYEAAEQNKTGILELAFKNYSNAGETTEFDQFISENEEWIHDFALYVALKKRFGGDPWYEWPEEYRARRQEALEKAASEEDELLRFVYWQQFTFNKQWKKLKTYCNERDIRFLGDIPFYVSYDSADVWANKELFHVDADGEITGVAGVPPDAFSEDGQLWGMPVFNWEALKEQDYKWWINRLARNMEMFDMVRLDHFRAFNDYWEVPGDEKTAVSGSWKAGPGAEFFEKVQAALGSLPFIAEDLGEMGPEVYALRDKFNMPGMKVLQFAFDENMPQSEHIPHHYKANFLAYTGTHDNNTTKGWFRQMAQLGVQERLETYLDKPVTEETICKEMARLVYGSIAKTAILPVQDVLGLDETAKMNHPGSQENNWKWRLMPGQIGPDALRFLSELTALYDRG